MKRKNKKTTPEITPEEALNQSMRCFEPLLSTEEFRLLQDEVKRPLLRRSASSAQSKNWCH
jgi:hypothetical protein